MALKTVLAALAVAIFAGLAAAEPAKPHVGIQSYDVIDGKKHLDRARREPLTAGVGLNVGGRVGPKSQIEASLTKKHSSRARREPLTVHVGQLGGRLTAKSQIEASLVRPKRFFGLHSHHRPKVILFHSQPSYVQPPPQVVYIRKNHRKYHHHRHHHRPGLTVHLG